jgi:antitoxin ParD1/3/4
VATETMNISLPDALKRYVEQRVADGGYGNTSEYIRELIRQDREERKGWAQQQLEELLLGGLDSGEPILVTPEWFEKRREELIARHQKSLEEA